MAAIVAGRRRLAPGIRYRAFVDMSGGSMASWGNDGYLDGLARASGAMPSPAKLASVPV
jgi:hypothetical protein